MRDQGGCAGARGLRPQALGGARVSCEAQEARPSGPLGLGSLREGDLGGRVCGTTARWEEEVPGRGSEGDV